MSPFETGLLCLVKHFYAARPVLKETVARANKLLMCFSVYIMA